MLLPYLALTWFAWHLRRLVSRQPCCHEVAPGLWLGRRPLAREVPAGVVLLVDLTAEFCAGTGVHSRANVPHPADARRRLARRGPPAHLRRAGRPRIPARSTSIARWATGARRCSSPPSCCNAASPPTRPRRCACCERSGPACGSPGDRSDCCDGWRQGKSEAAMSQPDGTNESAPAAAAQTEVADRAGEHHVTAAVLSESPAPVSPEPAAPEAAARPSSAPSRRRTGW